MSRKAKKRGKGTLERFELDATVLDVFVVDQIGRPAKRHTLFTATNVRDRRVGAGFTAEEAIASLREEDEREESFSATQPMGISWD